MTDLQSQALQHHLDYFGDFHGYQRSWYGFWRTRILNGDADALQHWSMPLSSEHCFRCNLPFDEEVSRHREFCSEGCFQTSMDLADQEEQDADVVLTNEQTQALANMEALAENGMLPNLRSFWTEEIQRNADYAIRGWNMSSDAPNCEWCALPFDEEESGLRFFCCTRCFDENDEQHQQEEEWGGEEEEEVIQPYSSRDNIAHIMAQISNAQPNSHQRLSYVFKLFICLCAEDRELLNYERFRLQVIYKMNEFDQYYTDHPDAPLRYEIGMAMNRCRVLCDTYPPPA